ncbi:retrovirus-related pol polyprotein from transposon TNT 1-94 [Tanacetum coccineum]
MYIQRGSTERKGFEKTKECYLTEVIPFFKTLKEHFEGIQKALTKEIKEMKEIFEELEAEDDQNVMNRKHDEIERKNILIANDNLISDCLSREVFYIATNSKLTVSRFTEMHAAYTVVQAHCLELEVELYKLLDKVQKDDHTELVKRFSNLEVVQIILWYLDSGCSKHMTGDRSQLRNFVKKFIGTVRFENDHFGAIMGYGDYVIGDSVISRHSCYVRDTDGVELIKGSRGSNLYTISRLKHDVVTPNHDGSPKPHELNHRLWHRLVNTGTTDFHQCPLPDRPMRVQTINGKKYILVILDDYSRFTWVKFLRSKDETLEVVIKFMKQIQIGLNKTVRYIRINNGTEFFNQVMTEYYERVGIFHQKLVPKTLQQNDVVERRNRTLMEAARTMLIFSKAPMFLWAEAVATACYTQNRSLIHTCDNKTPYELVHDKKSDLTFFRVFGALCYPTNDSEDLGKL